MKIKEYEIMKKNMSQLDRVLRAVIAVLFGVLVLGNFVSGTLAIVLMVVAIIFLFTALVGFCPLYTLFKFSTKK